MSLQELKDSACEAVDLASLQLKEISHSIWSNPELFYKEHHAHELISEFLVHQGFTVQKHTPLATSFIAKFGSPDGVKFGILCEYDALPEIGHACGHNLIAEAGLAAGLALKHVLERNPELKAQVTVLGTPAEEAGGGKVDMIKNNSFDDLDFCMMVHPYVRNVLKQPVLTCEEVEVTFHGKASHASCAPWDGINALDAAVQCYNSISMMRQQLKPSLRIHGVFTNGGEKPNIIPEKASLEYYLRGNNDKDVDELLSKFKACCEAAAMATGCTVEVVSLCNRYSNMIYNALLCELYKQNSILLGVDFPGDSTGDSLDSGSTDMGNVSHVTPSIHVLYAIPALGPCHTTAFAVTAGDEIAQLPTLNAGKAMAMTALDVIYDKSKLDTVKKLFQDQSI